MSALVINAGSSSVKFQVVDPASGELSAKGLVERIGEPMGAAGLQRLGAADVEVTQPFADHRAALAWVLERLADAGQLADVDVVGHRTVHGGRRFDRPAVIDDETVATMRELIPLAPLHNPANIQGIEAAREQLPQVPHVAVFDTGFFADLPEAVRTYAIDSEVAARYDVQRYGFHGASHAYVSRKVAEDLGRDPADLRVVVLHLGNGASAAAVQGGRAVDCSMGMTPLDGLVMGTRPGDVDPGVLLHLLRQGMGVDDVDRLLNRSSGLKGLTGSGDMREVRAAAEAGDERARLALDVVVHRIVRYVGAFQAVMGGLDVLVFTAGIGENNPHLRAEVCARLEGLGVRLDADRNGQVDRSSTDSTVVSAPDSPVTVTVTPTNEELHIARAAVQAVTP